MQHVKPDSVILNPENYGYCFGPKFLPWQNWGAWGQIGIGLGIVSFQYSYN
jgi:hypothetical protein